jgi:hypothetical protein
MVERLAHLSSGHTTLWRQLAQAYSKSLVTPFTSARLASDVLEMPVVDLYVKGSQGKHLLKRLLQERLPSYPAWPREAYLHVSFERHYQSGPLSDIWERHQPPDFLNPASQSHILGKASALIWHAIAYAVWRDPLLHNLNLPGAPRHYDRKWLI